MRRKLILSIALPGCQGHCPWGGGKPEEEEKRQVKKPYFVATVDRILQYMVTGTISPGWLKDRSIPVALWLAM
ncbi:MAG: hypothetical protein P8X55_21200, partial [Desulfosarcinaceae bacterium]